MKSTIEPVIEEPGPVINKPDKEKVRLHSTQLFIAKVLATCVKQNS